MSRDTSQKAHIDLAEKLWQLARTNPSELVEEMYTNDLAVEVLRAGLDLYIQQMQEEDQDDENGALEPENRARVSGDD